MAAGIAIEQITSETRIRSNLRGSNLSPYWNVLRSVGIPYDYAVRINLAYLILMLNRRNSLRRNILQHPVATA